MSSRPLAPTATAVASIQATLEAHAEVARRLNRQYELTSSAPVGVNAAGLEYRDLRRLIVLANEATVRKMLRSLTPRELQELRSTLDDEEANFSEYEYLASQNFLLERFQEAEARTEPTPPPALMPPVVVTQFASAADSFQTTPEILERQRVIYQNTALLRTLELPEGLPPPPPTPPSTTGAEYEFTFSFADLGFRMCVLDRATWDIAEYYFTVAVALLCHNKLSLHLRWKAHFGDLLEAKIGLLAAPR